MSQSSTIAFALIVGFIVFITVRGELPKYLGVLGLGSQAVSGTPSNGTTNGTTLGNTLTNAGNVINTIAAIPSLFGG